MFNALFLFMHACIQLFIKNDKTYIIHKNQIYTFYYIYAFIGPYDFRSAIMKSNKNRIYCITVINTYKVCQCT